MGKLDELGSVHPKTRAEWRAWLRRNHRAETGVWVQWWRANAGKPGPDYDDLVEEALCFGWIDSLAKPLDDRRRRMLFTPRRPGSGWSRPNKERVARLEKKRKIAAAGRAVIEAAKRDGSWSRMDDVENLVVPKDLAAAFRRHKGSKANWDAFPRSPRREMLAWILDARRPETRARRIEETARLAARGERANERAKDAR